jgi:ribosomal-protein-alanine N-acetyltransferase
MLNVRKIKESDVEQVAALERESFTDAWSEKSILETMQQSQAFVLVAEEDNVVVGYCIVYYALDEAEIARIAVETSRRKQGVGQELLRATCRTGIQQGVERLLLDVRESNVTAQNFYRAFGFVEDGIRKNFYQNPKEHAVLMSMSIV